MERITECLAFNIRKLRKQKQMTQSELAQKAGISLVFLQGIESERKWISPATVRTVAAALQVPEHKLFENCSKKAAGFDHVPDDIFDALSTTCQHPEWKWEVVRWIVNGFKTQSSN